VLAACALSLYLSPSLSHSEFAAGSVGAQIPARFPARLVENRRLGDDYRRHMQRIHGTLDASIFFPAWTPSRRLGNPLKTMMSVTFDKTCVLINDGDTA